MFYVEFDVVGNVNYNVVFVIEYDKGVEVPRKLKVRKSRFRYNGETWNLHDFKLGEQLSGTRLIKLI